MDRYRYRGLVRWPESEREREIERERKVRLLEGWLQVGCLIGQWIGWLETAVCSDELDFKMIR